MIKYSRKYKTLSDKDKIEYSASKLGDKNSIKTVATNILKLVENVNDYDCIVSVPHQHVGFLSNPAELEGIYIAKHLNLEYLYMKRTLRSGQKQYFYYTKEERQKLNEETIIADINVFKGKKVILIDDLVASGAVINTCISKLKEANVSNLQVLTDIILEPEDYKYERDLDSTLLQKYVNGESDKLKEIINNLEYGQTVITKRLLELIFASGLKTKDFENLSNELSTETLNNLIQYADKYFSTTSSRLTVNIKSLIPTAK